MPKQLTSQPSKGGADPKADAETTAPPSNAPVDGGARRLPVQASTAQVSAPVTPLTTTPVAASRLPTIPPCVDFYLAYHPARWDVNEHGQLMPSLQKLPIRPGVDNIGQLKGRRVDGSTIPAQHAALEQDGWFVIPKRLGPDGGYTRSVQVVGGVAHITAREKPLLGRSTTVSDLQAYTEWLWGLIIDGHLPPADTTALEDLRRTLERYAGSAAQRAARNPRFQAQADRYEAAIKAVDAALAPPEET